MSAIHVDILGETSSPIGKFWLTFRSERTITRAIGVNSIVPFIPCEEYVRSKLDIVRAQPRENASRALLAALRDDWQPAVSIRGEKNATREKPVRAGNRSIGNSNEHCDFQPIPLQPVSGISRSRPSVRGHL